MRRSAWLLCLLVLVMGTGLQAAIRLEKPWVRASSGPNAALFVTLVNISPTRDALIGAEIEGCERTELHDHIETNGVFRMVEVPEIGIPGKGQMELKPGAHHVMLRGIQAPLHKGDTMFVRFVFKSHPPLSVRVPIKVEGTTKCWCESQT